MALHAVDDIDDAIDATKSLLVPFELGTWLRMALLVLFVGGGGGGLNLVQNIPNLDDFGGGSGPGSGPGGFSVTATADTVVRTPGSLLQTSPDVPADPAEALAGVDGAVLAAVVVGALLLFLLFAVLGAVMEFAFVQALVAREVHVRRYVRAHLGNGLRLLAFRFGFGLLALVVFGGLVAVAVSVTVGVDNATQNPAALAGSLGVLAVVVALWVLVAGVVQGFTNVFVVPLMIEGDHGVLSGWSRLWTSLTGAPKQYLAYLFLSVVLAIGVSIVGTILGAIALVVVGIPFGIAGGVFWAVLGGSHIGAVVVGFVAVLFGLVMLVVANMIKAPLQAFLRYYAMLVLGDVDDDLDPIPDVRTAVRT